jgi:tetratricopeptide (TPR) repeat protein
VKSAEQLEQDVRRLIQAGRVRNAAEACDHLNQQYPEFESGWYTASHLAMVINEPVLAVRAIEHALQLSPGKPEWLMQRMECLGAMGNLDAARATARSMSGHLFDSAAVSAVFAGSLSRIGLFADAQRHFKHATELEPGEGQHFFNLATVEQFLGNTAAAHAAVSQCLALCPDDAGAHLLRAQLQTQTPAANNVAALRTAYSHAASEPQRRGTLCYALAKELEDIGKFESSFEYLSEGAAIKRAALHYEPQADLDVMRKIRETYTAELFDGRIEGHINAEPIFVLGLPRTGTGLVQRILGGHSVVHPAGELTTF